MKLYAVVLRDEKVGAFMTPMFQQSKAAAVRSFQDAVNRDPEREQFAAHPEDYNLFCVGEFDPETGELVGHAPEHLALGSNLVRREA